METTTQMGGTMTEAQREALIDRMVMRRLASDHRYVNAENAEEQAEAEEQITDEVIASLAK